MRIVGFFIRSLLSLGILAALVYFVGGYLWMTVSLGSFRSNISVLEDSLANTSTINKLCVNAPASSPYSVPKAIQLRFIDNKNYVLEVVCSLIENTPVQMGMGTLPSFIEKEQGSSGFYVDMVASQPSSVTLRSLAAT